MEVGPRHWGTPATDLQAFVQGHRLRTGNRVPLSLLCACCFSSQARRKCCWGSAPKGSGGQQRRLLVAGLARLSLSGRAPATHTAVSPAQHPQPGAAAAVLSSPSSRRGASVWSPLRSGWGNRSGAGGDELTPPPARLRSPNQLQMRPVAPPAGPRAPGSGPALSRACGLPAFLLRGSRPLIAPPSPRGAG